MIRKDGEVDIPSSPCSREPSTCYHEEVPEKITLPVEGLLSRIPAEYRTQTLGEASSNRSLDLPCRELFSGNTPRLRLGLLRELLPDLVTIPEGIDQDLLLPLPAGWLALHFQLIARSAELSPESGKKAQEKPVEKKATESAEPTVPVGSEANGEALSSAPIPAADTIENVVLEEKKHGFFASLPIFKRHEPEVVIAEVTEPPKEISEVKETTLTLDHLWKLDPNDQLADPTALQSLFMTDEKLTLDRVVSLAGALPGLRACVLAHGDQVVCASHAPAGVDLQLLSGQATVLLAQIRESSSKMGLGAVPAMTLHGEQGTLSFLHQGELCLLVLHADRGFVPGVRERLQEMLGHLGSAQRAIEG